MGLYKIKELFYTLQGEGFHSGRPAVFCRFSGCNLWSGLEKDREKAICQFCDTDFWGTDGLLGGRYNAEDLVATVLNLWPKNRDTKPFVVCTGGEPLLQLDKSLIQCFHKHHIEVAVETNGTIEAPEGIDWVCVSPKANTQVVISSGNELKLVYPQADAHPSAFEHLAFDHFYLQPMDGPNLAENTSLALEYCKKNPKWKLSIQLHKVLNIP